VHIRIYLLCERWDPEVDLPSPLDTIIPAALTSVGLWTRKVS
jgi:hypothetical protein